MLCAIIPALFIVFFVCMPESPYYLVKEGKIEKAEDSLMKLRMDTRKGVQGELQTMRTTIEGSVKVESGFFDIFKSKGLTKALIISLSLVSEHCFSTTSFKTFRADLTCLHNKWNVNNQKV